MSLFSLGSSAEVCSLLRRSSSLVITSSISAGTGSTWSLWRPVGVWCDAALSRIVRRIFLSIWQSVGRERLLRAASTSRHRQGHLMQAHIPPLSNCKTLEKCLLPYITANIPNTPMQHGYKTQYTTVTTLHTLNNIVTKGLNQMAPPA